jgi:hypothetical protein
VENRSMIVLPMAGLSSRFYEAGYCVPKYMLELEGRSVFAHALGSFEKQFQESRFLLICRDIAQTADFVRSEYRQMGLSDDQVDLVLLETETEGQADTVLQGLNRVETAPGLPLTIFNIDTFRPGFDYPVEFDAATVDGYLEVFKGEGDRWSFVRPFGDDTFRAREVTEKIRISNLCCTGLYHFRSIDLFRDLYAMTAGEAASNLQGGERYVAPLYNLAILNGQDIRYHLVPKKDVRFCGTPQEYEDLLADGS